MVLKALLVAAPMLDVPLLTLHNGPWDDVNMMSDMLKLLGFPPENITILGAAPPPSYNPTGIDIALECWITMPNLLAAVAAWKAGATQDDHLVFYYSGHGTYGYNAAGVLQGAIVPSVPGQNLFSDDLFALLMGPNGSGAQVTTIFDCCDAGKLMKLYSRATYISGVFTPVHDAGTYTRQNRNFSFAACGENETSNEFTPDHAWAVEPYRYGVFTQSLTSIVTANPTITNIQLLAAITDAAVGRNPRPQIDYTKGALWLNAPFLSIIAP